MPIGARQWIVFRSLSTATTGSQRTIREQLWGSYPNTHGGVYTPWSGARGCPAEGAHRQEVSGAEPAIDGA